MAAMDGNTIGAPIMGAGMRVRRPIFFRTLALEGAEAMRRVLAATTLRAAALRPAPFLRPLDGFRVLTLSPVLLQRLLP
jgi:hypothetical protein